MIELVNLCDSVVLKLRMTTEQMHHLRSSNHTYNYKLMFCILPKVWNKQTRFSLIDATFYCVGMVYF